MNKTDIMAMTLLFISTFIIITFIVFITKDPHTFTYSGKELFETDKDYLDFKQSLTVNEVNICKLETY